MEVTTKSAGKDINDIQIRDLDHVIGQDQVTNALKMYIEAHFKKRMAFSSSDIGFGPALFDGPSGTGKTFMAKVIHFELGNDKFFETNGVTLNNISEFYNIFLNADENTTIFIDEAQVMSSRIQHLLLTAISERVIYVPAKVKTCSQCTISLSHFGLILATTDEHMLLGALRNRMSIHCRFEPYSIEELVQIVRQRAIALGWSYENDDVLYVIAQRSKGIARIALNTNLKTCWDYAISRDHMTITVDDALKAFELIRIDEFGLDKLDRDYLSNLLEYGPLPLNVLSSKLSLPNRAIQNVIEPYLIKEGFIMKDRSSFRLLTEKGRDHIKKTVSVVQ